MKKIMIMAQLLCASFPIFATHINVSSNISTNTVWTSNNTYTLDGMIVVDSGVTLTIQPGVTICSGSGSGLIVQSTAALIANGTADSMIVFTSNKAPHLRQSGDWGGVTILGNAVNNVVDNGGGLQIIVRNGINYYGGGNNDLHNGGSLQYVSIAYAGEDIIGDTYNGALVLNSLGSSTNLSHIQIINSKTDGMVLLGGLPNITELYLQNNQGRDLLIDAGNRSSITSLLAIKNSNMYSFPLGTIGIAVYNNESSPLNLPLSQPVLDAFTLIGPQHCGAVTGDASIGMYFDYNGGGDFRNGVVSGFETGLFIEGNLSMARTANGTLNFSYCAVVMNATNLFNNPSLWSGCIVSPNTIETWFVSGCGNNNNQVGNGVLLDYDASICNDYCDAAPILKLGDASELSNRPLSELKIGVIQEEPAFSWLSVCSQSTCQVPELKAKHSVPLQVYPNPSKEQVLISIPADLPTGTVMQVVDMVTGHQFSYMLPVNTAEYRMDISNFAGGFYKIYIVIDAVIYEGKLQVIPQ